MGVPTGPEEADKLAIFGMTVNDQPLLATPLTVTTRVPEVALVGTGTTILVKLQLVGVPAVPLNLTVLEPCVDPNPDPLIVIEVPTFADVGDTLPIDGAACKRGRDVSPNRRVKNTFEQNCSGALAKPD